MQACYAFGDVHKAYLRLTKSAYVHFKHVKKREKRRAKGGVATISHDEESGKTGEVLYRRYLGGDDDALRELIRLYQEPLIAFINGIVNDPNDARELAIDAFAELARKKGRFRGDSAIKTYLFGIGRNMALNHLRGRGRNLPLEELESESIQGGNSPEERMERDERERQLEAAMGELKAEHYTVLRLLYYEDKSYEEAGKEMNRTQTQIANLAYRARHALRKNLEREGFTYGE